MPRSDLLRALALCAPLAVLLAADKALKLSWLNGTLAADLKGGIWTIVWHSLLQPAFESALGIFAVAVLIIGALLGRLAGRRARAWVGYAFGMLAVYSAMAMGAFLHGEAHPWWPFALSQALRDLQGLIALWWRDAAAVTLVAGLIARPAARSIRDRNVVRCILIWCVLALAYVLVALDIAFFAGTREALNASDLYFALSSPSEAWVVSRGAISMRATMVLSEILVCGLACALAAFLSARSEAFSRSWAPHTRASRLGLALWPALALAVASPAATHGRQMRAVNDPLLNVSIRDAEYGFLRMRAPRERGPPSAIVPTLHVEPVALTPTAATRPWNVVIVMLESARARDTTVYTPNLNTTPFLAQLARESLVVDHMYAVIPRTTDAWVSILAGRYASSDSVVGNWANHPSSFFPSSLPRLLRARGYESAFFLPTTLNFGADAVVVRALGFDEVVTKESIPEPASGLVTPFGWEDRALLRPIGRWLDQRASDKRPFLLTVMTNVGHAPFGLPSDYHMQQFPSLNEKHERYLNCMHYVDAYMRDLVQELRDRGLLDKTVLIVLGDHGEEFGEHGSFLRAAGLHEELLQIPMIIRLPAVARRTGHIGGLRQQMDVLPTVADALGLELSGGPLPGSSLLSDPRGHEALFFAQYWDKTALAVRIGDLKYVYSFDRGPPETFDLSSDPMELRNIAAQLSPRDESQARIDMLAWRDRAAQTFPAENRSGPIGSDRQRLSAAGPVQRASRAKSCVDIAKSRCSEAH